LWRLLSVGSRFADEKIPGIGLGTSAPEGASPSRCIIGNLKCHDQLPRFEYVQPKTLEEGLSLLEQAGGRARILAGGTDLLVNMKYRLVCPDIVISIDSVVRSAHLRFGNQCLNGQM